VEEEMPHLYRVNLEESGLLAQPAQIKVLDSLFKLSGSMLNSSGICSLPGRNLL
jgi:hypothetical protein